MPPGKTFKGLSYGDWVAIWSNWLISRDVESYDGEDMLFLRGYVGYKAVSDAEGAMRYQDPESFLDRTGDKKLKILKGTSVFVPTAVSVNAVGCDFEGKLIENEKDLRNAVNEDIDHVRSIWATVKLNHSKESIKIVPDLRSYRIETPLFKLTVPEDSALTKLMDYPMKPGVYDAVAGGYFVLLPDLAPSTYQIDFGCEGPGDYSTSGVYDIIVYRDTRKRPKDISNIPCGNSRKKKVKDPSSLG
jgi:hypothetical protein